MAKSKAAASKGTAVVVRGSTAPAKLDPKLPAFLQAYTGPRGTEGIEAADVTIPRIKIGQGTSEEVKDGTLNEGDLFLNLTKEVLAEDGAPLRFTVIARGKEYILWRPRKDNGGGILARAKPVNTPDGVRYRWDKPNTTFDVKVDGKVKAEWTTQEYIDEDGLDQWGSEIPGNSDSGIAATAHHNYVVVLLDHDEMVAALSLSRSTARKAKDFNALLKLGSAPMFGRVFTATTVDEHNDQGDFKSVKIENAGYVEDDQFPRFKGMFESFAGRVINVDVSDKGDDTPDDNKRNSSKAL